MGLRAKLAKQAAPFLESGEQVQAVLRARTCFDVREARLSRCPMWHLIAVTDRAIVIMDLSMLTHRPTRLRSRHSRHVYFGCSRRFTFDHKKYWITREFDDQIAAADAALVDLLRWGDVVDEIKLAGHDHAVRITDRASGQDCPVR